MKRNGRWYILAAVLVAGLAAMGGWRAYRWAYPPEWVDYVPLSLVERGRMNSRFEPRRSLLTEGHVKAMIGTLERYGEAYRMKGGRLQIRRTLAEKDDGDYLWNLTWKAGGWPRGSDAWNQDRVWRSVRWYEWRPRWW